jgi:2,4-dienoyl-CoA reductase (NADPH2)
MIVGGGPAGMSAALAAKERGHDVTIYEKTERLGGQLFLAATPPGREEFKEFAKDLAVQVRVNNIKTIFKATVDEALLKQEKPDQVILATGAKPLTIPVPGAELPHVVQAWDVLTDKATTGKNVVVIGGGAVGVEVALFLAEKGTMSGDALKFLLINDVESVEDLKELAVQGTKNVTVLEMLEKAGQDIGRSTRWVMMSDLSRFGVTTLTETKALEITTAGIKVERNNETETIPADTVVMATGSVPENALQETLTALSIPFELAGDAKQIGLAFDAVHQGFETGRAV